MAIGPVFDSAFERVLYGKIKERAEQEATNLTVGFAQDFADYRNRVGKIEAYQAALDCFEEAHKELRGDNEKKDAKK